MDLDFSAIREAAERPKAPAPRGSSENTIQTAQLVNAYKQEQVEHERCISIFKGYQKNIKASEEMQAEILKAVKAGESPTALFLKAAKCISLMTSNEVFYEQIECDILSIYGSGLLEPDSVQLELERVNERLEKLESARDRETGDNKRRIESAIKIHRIRAAELENLLLRKDD